MPTTFFNELNKLTRAKSIISLLPARARFRVAKKLYDYESGKINGIDIVAPLQNGGLVCFINTKDLIGWKIFFFGEYEQDTNTILTRYIKKDDVVIEAGANMGSETLLIAKLAHEGKVYAFEPNPYTYERLRINADINKLDNIHPSDIALGESDKQMSFNIFPKDFCNSGMSSKYMETSRSIKISVVQKTLDTFVAENDLQKIDFIKMDIQGAEMDMLMGATGTIARFRPTIFTEACEPYNNTRDLYAKIREYGYKVCLITGNELLPMNTASDVKDGNWLAINEK